MIELDQMMPFASLLGIEFERTVPGEVVARMNWRPDLCTAGEAIHGGALMALADSVGGVCAFLNLPEGANTATISSSTNLLRAVRGGEVVARARPLHVGRSVVVVRSELVDERGRGVADTTQAQAVLGS